MPSPANFQQWTVSSGSSGTQRNLPFTSGLTVSWHIDVTAPASVAIEANFNDDPTTGTWIALTNMSAITADTVTTFAGPLRWVRPTVTVGGSAIITMIWGDNK
jgi:hypothetical protein